MRKLQITAIGEPADVLQLVEFQAPTPGPGHALVEVQAATINDSDFLYISGQYFTTPQPPADVGAEGVGRVLAVGPGENESLVGARVLLLPTYRHGTWATHVIAATTDIVVVPDDIDTVQLAMGRRFVGRPLGGLESSHPWLDSPCASCSGQPIDNM
jgi:mitochondrial enoyl-[acyl-carrier protein] reductase / trans-2-enoyl-CoA reductase